ncbi:MAG: alpha/beta fold hydrolase [Candidatus Helarchaeota archaeon]
MAFTEVNGVKLYYEEYGSSDKPAIILIHGWTADHNRWKDQVEVLKDNYRVITPDLRGHGKSDKDESIDYSSINILSDDLKGLMDNLNIQKAIIAGHSMGGMTVMQFTLDYPEKVEKLILVDTIAKFSYSFGRKLLTGISNILPYNSFIKLQISRAFRKGWDKEQINKLTELALQNPKYVVYRFYKAMKKFNVLEKLSNIKVPTLIIHGEKDIQLPLDQAKKIHEQISGSKLVVIEEAGHEVIVEEPEKVVNAILEFIK